MVLGSMPKNFQVKLYILPKNLQFSDITIYKNLNFLVLPVYLVSLHLHSPNHSFQSSYEVHNCSEQALKTSVQCLKMIVYL